MVTIRLTARFFFCLLVSLSGSAGCHDVSIRGGDAACAEPCATVRRPVDPGQANGPDAALPGPPTDAPPERPRDTPIDAPRDTPVDMAVDSGPAMDQRDACGTRDDPANCGRCGHDCRTLPHIAKGATVFCRSGACEIPSSSCEPGWGHCSPRADDGCETDLRLASTCGSCTRACSGDLPICAAPPGAPNAPTCVSGCMPHAPARCEASCVNHSSDVAHCGRCGNACRFDHAAALCDQATCKRGQCEAGWDDCNQIASDGCETPLDTATNCGACRSACSVPNGVAACQNRRCVVTGCNRNARRVGDTCVPCNEAIVGYCVRGVDGMVCAQTDDSGTMKAPARVDGYWSNSQGWGTQPFLWGTVQMADVDGDGFVDVCGRSHQGIVCTLGLGATGFAAPTAVSEAFADDLGWYTSRSFWGTIQLADVRGNGRLRACGRAGDMAYCYSWTAGGFSSLQDYTIAGPSDVNGYGVDPSRYATIQYPDVNGDGKADLCARAAEGISCAPATASDSSAWASWTADKAFGDLDGFSQSGRWETIQFPDVNGDGKQDVCGRAATGLRCALSTGTSFGKSTAWTTEFSDTSASAPWGTTLSHFSTIQFPDLDGDGKQDVCGRGKAGLLCGLSTGSAFGPVTLWGGDFSNAKGFGEQRFAMSVQFADLDRDGKADVCGRDGQQLVCGYSNGSTGFGNWKRVAGFKDSDGFSEIGQWASTTLVPLVTETCRPARKTPLPWRPAARVPF